MSEIVFFTGVVTLSTLAAAVVVFLLLAAIDAVICARFIWRVRKAARCDGCQVSDWHMVKAWFRYWVGIDIRPEYLALISNDETIYWPGKEGSRRYPG